ncbi:MAG: D-tyrosyl-tRNA(Tyr) deacylase [Deltaproteobacteria bacterium]|nr:D-tyrosyl-tRNA(Tyr) deacylase [Deltaproteobacteria bacterium]
MKALVQRVSQASVSIGGAVTGQIGQGLLVLVGAAKGDGEADADWLADKVAGLRIFPDQEGKMGLSVSDLKGQALVISQFTLLGDTRKGKRPSFTDAAEPVLAEALYERFGKRLSEKVEVAWGRFGAHMMVSLVNDGPVTLMLESPKADKP